MAEIDTRPLESVQAALNIFEQRSDHSRFSSPDRNEQEIDVVRKELAACKLQLEVKENENRQENLRMEALNKAMQELSEKYDGACLEAYDRIAELETDVVLITRQQSKTASECEALRDELAAARGELGAVRRANEYVLGEVESMETRRILERESARDGLMRVLELNEAVLASAVAAMRAEEERSVFLQEATLELVSSGRNVEAVRRQKEAMESMEGELLAKTVEVDCLRSELKKLRELYVSREVAANDQEQGLDVVLQHAEKETCLATEISREDDQEDGKMTEHVVEAEVVTVLESTACQGDSEVADTYFDSELPGDRNVQYDDDGVLGSISGSMPEHVAEGEEEPEIGNRFVAESPRQDFQSVNSEYCKDISAAAGIGMPENLAGNEGSRPKGVTETEIVVVNSKDVMPASMKKKEVRFLDESFKSMNSDDCKDMNAGIGVHENRAGRRRSEPEVTGAGLVTEIVVVNSKEGHDDLCKKEVVDTDKLGDGYVLVAKKNAGTDGEEALKDEKLDAAHAEISDLRFSLEEAVRRAELAEEANAALARELKKEIKTKQRQPRPTQDASGKCKLYASPARPPATAPSEDQRRVARPAPSCVTLGKVLNMKYR
ncbi:hypothetical protein ACQ4PT_039373 [Festuca glaucescens]